MLKAFQILDTDKSGDLTLKDLVGRFNATRHPQVLAGEKTEQQVCVCCHWFGFAHQKFNWDDTDGVGIHFVGSKY